MPVVPIKVGGRDYQVACDAGQEDHLRFLADELNDRFNTLFFNVKKPPSDAIGLLMAGLMLADELMEARQEAEYFMHNPPQDGLRSKELEVMMAGTLEDIASRIEKIAEEIDIR